MESLASCGGCRPRMSHGSRQGKGAGWNPVALQLAHARPEAPVRKEWRLFQHVANLLASISGRRATRSLEDGVVHPTLAVSAVEDELRSAREVQRRASIMLRQRAQNHLFFPTHLALQPMHSWRHPRGVCSTEITSCGPRTRSIVCVSGTPIATGTGAISTVAMII